MEKYLKMRLKKIEFDIITYKEKIAIEDNYISKMSDIKILKPSSSNIYPDYDLIQFLTYRLDKLEHEQKIEHSKMERKIYDEKLKSLEIEKDLIIYALKK
jgi:hypothetical protein